MGWDHLMATWVWAAVQHSVLDWMGHWPDPDQDSVTQWPKPRWPSGGPPAGPELQKPHSHCCLWGKGASYPPQTHRETISVSRMENSTPVFVLGGKHFV